MDDSMPEQMDIPECTAACKKPVLEQRMRIKEADKKKCCVLTIPSPKQTDAVPRVASLKGLCATCGGNQAVGRKEVGSDTAKMVTSPDSHERLFYHSISWKKI